MVRFSNRRSNTTPAAGADRRRQRADRRRVEILRAAARVFRTRGFAAAGMREIAVAAELSPANLYHYFRGKDELLYFCQNRSLDRLLAALADARAATGPLDRRLRALAVAHVRCLLDEVEGSAAHFEVDALPPKLRAAIVAKRDRYERGIRAIVARGIRAGSLAPGDPTVVTRAFLGALNWTARWFNPDGPYSPDQIASLVGDYAAGGLVYARYQTRAHRPDRQPRTRRGRVRAVQNAARGAA
ncbi:MAG: TetR/AcrR family transcriptional regulator [Betaproteobacteria bacterium]